MTESRLRRAGSGLAEFKEQGHAMDIERINALGAQLTDLSQRTADLRRYL